MKSAVLLQRNLHLDQIYESTKRLQKCRFASKDSSKFQASFDANEVTRAYEGPSGAQGDDNTQGMVTFKVKKATHVQLTDKSDDAMLTSEEIKTICEKHDLSRR